MAAVPFASSAPLPGDEVLVRGTMVRADRTQVLVELHNVDGPYQVSVRPDTLELDPILVPDEPEDGALLPGRPDYEGRSSMFRRDDAEGHCDPDRRHDRRWWDYAAGEWIDWPTAVRRGADPTARLVLSPAE